MCSLFSINSYFLKLHIEKMHMENHISRIHNSINYGNIYLAKVIIIFFDFFFPKSTCTLMLLRKFCICYFKYCCFCIIKSNTIFKPVKIRLISQLIKGLSSVLQKLLKYFNGGTIISTFYVSSSTVNKVLLSTAWKLAIGLAIVKVSLSL